MPQSRLARHTGHGSRGVVAVFGVEPRIAAVAERCTGTGHASVERSTPALRRGARHQPTGSQALARWGGKQSGVHRNHR